MTQVRIILHLPGSVLLGAEPLKPFYRDLRDGVLARGGAFELAIHDRSTLADEVAEDDDFHIVDHGNFRHPRVLNTGIAYVYPYWHLDPWGIRAGASIAAQPFPLDQIDGDAARQFMRGLHHRQVTKRASRYPQPDARADFPERCIAVFLQSEAHRDVAETCYLDRAQMLAALLARDDPAPIVVKIHPRDHSEDTRNWLADLAARDPRLIVTEANIHDILTHAKVTVTINSAVGIESLIHRVPVVLCGRSDFHHCTETVQTPADMDGGLTRALTATWPYGRYLYWYFKLNCIGSGSATLIDDVFERIETTGFDVARFGMR